MPRADEYAGAAAWLAECADTAQAIDAYEDEGHATLAARCVRAMAAWKAGEVMVDMDGDNQWIAWIPEGDGRIATAADPLDAITAALGGDDGK